MLKKAFILVIILCALGSLGGVFLAGLNMYTRSTTPAEDVETSTTTAPEQHSQTK